MAEVEKPGLWERLRESLTPRFAPDKPGAHHGHRSMVSSVFLSMLLAQAYAELFPPIRDSVRTHHGLMWSTGLLAFAFFVVSMRFFVGNQLYLLSDKTLGLRGDLWLMDFLVIVLETVLICFLAGLPTAALNRSVRIDFLLLLIVLYIVDISWVVMQIVLGRVVKVWKREFVPWKWGVLNAGLLVVLILVRSLSDDPYRILPLVLVVIANAIGFVIDILLIDEYDFI